MYYHIFILIGIMLFFGAWGGLINYYFNGKIRTKTGEAKSSDFTKSIVTGIGAAFLVPLFLNMLSSNLVEETSNDLYKMLVFSGFCLTASISSRTFISSLADKVLKEMDENNRALHGRIGKVEEVLESLRKQKDEEKMIENEK